MRPERDDSTTRRALLCGAGRWAGLASLAALAGGLLARSRAKDDCPRLRVCPGCPILRRCRLPEAKAARAVRKT